MCVCALKTHKGTFLTLTLLLKYPLVLRIMATRRKQKKTPPPFSLSTTPFCRLCQWTNQYGQPVGKSCVPPSPGLLLSCPVSSVGHELMWFCFTGFRSMLALRVYPLWQTQPSILHSVIFSKQPGHNFWHWVSLPPTPFSWILECRVYAKRTRLKTTEHDILVCPS